MSSMIPILSSVSSSSGVPNAVMTMQGTGRELREISATNATPSSLGIRMSVTTRSTSCSSNSRRASMP